MNSPSNGSGKVYVVSLGCPKNLVDTEKYVAFLGTKRFSLAESPESADLILVNTCGFINDAKRESIETILEMVDVKKEYQKLVVAGCLVDRYAEDLAKELPEVDLWMDLSRLDRVDREFENILQTSTSPTPTEIPWLLRPRARLTPDHTAYLKISEGCDRSCAFCSIPSFKGKQASFPLSLLVEEARQLVKDGAREITLIGQDTVSYGRDLSGEARPNLRDLLVCLNEIEDLAWIRLLYTYPTRSWEDLEWCFQNLGKLVPYLDMPVQHLSDPVLARMRRGTPYRLIRDSLARLRDAVPELVIRSTCLVGFPGETEADLELMKERFCELQVDHLGVFAYSDEEGTSAYTLDGKLHQDEITRRYTETTQWAAEYCQSRAETRLGRQVRVLVDHRMEAPVPDLCPGQGDGFVYKGRTNWQAPEIDGGVFFVAAQKIKTGTFVHVHLERVSYPEYGAFLVVP